MSSTIPFLIAVTGHRDVHPDDRAAVQRALREVLATTVRLAGSTPVWLVSGMAEGADQLAAEAALAQGVTVVALPPVPWDIYRADFADDAWTAVEHLRRQCRAVPSAAPVREAGEDDAAWRQRGYERLGDYLSRACPMLIAVWDGVEGLKPTSLAKRGGTAHVLHAHLHGISATSGTQALDLAPFGYALHIHTRRSLRPPSTALAPGHIQTLSVGAMNDAEADERLLGWLKRLRTVNEDIATLTAADVDRSRGYLAGVKAKEGEKKKAEHVKAELGLDAPALAPMITAFATLDAVAGQLQERHHGRMPKPVDTDAPPQPVWVSLWAYWRKRPPIGLLQGILLLGLLGLLVQQFRPFIAPGSQTLLAVSVLLLGGAYLLFWRGTKVDLQGRYLECRAIAEGLRVAVFWRAAGVSERVADSYLHRQRGTGDSVRYILHALELQADAASLGQTAYPPDPRAAIRTCWVADQAEYFEKSSYRDFWNNTRMKRWAKGLFWGGLAAGPLAALLPDLAGIGSVGVAIQFMAGTLAAFAAALALDEHVQSYRRMGEIFRRAEVLVDQGLDLALLVRELGCEALAENATWLTLHRSRPPSFGKSNLITTIDQNAATLTKRMIHQRGIFSTRDAVG
jgi:hypothetical protein